MKDDYEAAGFKVADVTVWHQGQQHHFATSAEARAWIDKLPKRKPRQMRQKERRPVL